MPHESIYFRLWFLLGLLVVGIVTGGFWFYEHHDAGMKGHIVEQLHAIATLQVEDIQRWRQEQIADAWTFLGTPFMVETTHNMWLGKWDPEMMEGIVARLHNLKKHDRYQAVLLITPEGEIHTGTSGRSGPIHEEALEGMRRAFETHQPTFTDIHILPKEKAPHFDCILPFQIQDLEGVYQPVFAVVLRIDIRRFISPYIQNWPIPSDSAETLLVRREGNVVRYLNKLRHSDQEPYTLTVPLDRDEIPAVQAVKGRTGYTEGRDYRGVPVLAYVVPVPDTSWILIAKIDRHEALRQAAFESRIIFVLMSASILVVLSGIGLIYHRSKEKQFKTLYEAEQRLRRSELRYKATLMSIGDGVIVTDPSGRVTMMNPVAETLTGWSFQEAEGKPIEEVFPIVNEETRTCVANPVHRVCRDGCVVGLANHTILVNRQGKDIPIADCGAPISGPEGGIEGVVLVFRDQSHERAAAIKERQKALVDAAIADLSRHLLEPKADIPSIAPIVLEHCLRLTNSPYGFVGTIDEHTGELLLDAVRGADPCILGDMSTIHFVKGPDGRYPGLWGHCLNSGQTLVAEDPFNHPSARGVPEGHIALERFLSVPLFIENKPIGQIALANSPEPYSEDRIASIERIRVLYGMFLSLKRMGAKLSEIEDRLFQNQKMEAIGRLAGGVAHDFNNMLQVIQSFSELAKTRMESLEGDLAADLRRYIDRIQQTAEKSADLTQKLLAFARKQTTTPRRIALNDTIETMLKMVRRLIGENIELLWKPGSHLDCILIDPSQIDQILVNLAVNARDAIDVTGTITVETRAVDMDADDARRHPFVTPGRYVVLSVADTGCGMNEKTKSMIFEPFFTTKPLGKGTGLGLSTVYGIIKQNNGHITVYSEPGRGTVFHLYFPVCTPDAAANGPVKAQTVQRGTETILLVEDDPTLLEVAQTTLETLGYVVLPASQPSDAIRMARTYPGTIHLLLTDMIMPEMNGRQLAQAIQQDRSDIRCLFMSGYTQDVFSPDGKLDPDIPFIQKPFAVAVLSQKIREVMEKP